MFKSIRKRLIFNFVVLSAFIIILTTAFSTYQIIKGLENQMKYDGITLANTIKNDIQNIESGNLELIQGMIDETYKDAEGNLYYIGVISPDKTLIAGTSKEAIGQKFETEELDDVFNKGNTIAYMNEWKGTPAYNVTVPIKKGDTVVSSVSVGISVSNMKNSIKAITIKSVLAGVGILLVASIIGAVLGKQIAKPIESIKETVEKIGEGDLIVEYSVSSKDELGILATVSNETTKNLREFIRKTKSISSSLNNLSKDVSMGGQQVSAASEEIASSVTSVSQEGIKQTEDLENAVKLLEDFSQDLNGVNNRLTELASQGEFIRQDANKGSEKINDLSNTIGDMKNSFDMVKNKVENLGGTITQINSIVDVINSVAAQTNLLALNASIEAARAGEAGRGFSVVAEEIRKLAEEVLESSKSITDLVNKVIEETHNVSNTTDIASRRVEESRENVGEAVESFKAIIEKVNNIPKEINEVYKVLQGTMEGRNKVLYTIESIALNSEEISSLSEEVTASTEEQAAITNEMAVAAKKLRNMAKVLESNVSSFNV